MVMERIEHSDDGDMRLALKILSWIYRARRTLFMDELLECLAVEDGNTDLQRDFLLGSAVIECCKSVIIYDESSGAVRFTHYAVAPGMVIQLSITWKSRLPLYFSGCLGLSCNETMTRCWL